MPVSTQCLYFHLGLHADDDGVVEAYTIMNVVGATEDDLKILVAKNFVNVLNEDLVTYITDWKENNKIRADRKIDSIYKDLLIQVIPDIEILGKKPRADRPPKILDDSGTSQGQPWDVPGTTMGLHRLGKVRLGKDSIGKNSIPTKEENVSKSVDNSIDENLATISKLYQENIGQIYPANREWIIEVSEKIKSDLFKRAIEICIDKKNVTPGYLKGIIKNWLERDITSLEQLKTYEVENNKSNNSISQNNKSIPNRKLNWQINETFREYDPKELERALLEMQKKEGM